MRRSDLSHGFTSDLHDLASSWHGRKMDLDIYLSTIGFVCGIFSREMSEVGVILGVLVGFLVGLWRARSLFFNGGDG